MTEKEREREAKVDGEHLVRRESLESPTTYSRAKSKRSVKRDEKEMQENGAREGGACPKNNASLRS